MHLACCHIWPLGFGSHGPSQQPITQRAVNAKCLRTYTTRTRRLVDGQRCLEIFVHVVPWDLSKAFMRWIRVVCSRGHEVGESKSSRSAKNRSSVVTLLGHAESHHGAGATPVRPALRAPLLRHVFTATGSHPSPVRLGHKGKKLHALINGFLRCCQQLFRARPMR